MVPVYILPTTIMLGMASVRRLASDGGSSRHISSGSRANLSSGYEAASARRDILIAEAEARREMNDRVNFD